MVRGELRDEGGVIASSLTCDNAFGMSAFTYAPT